MPRHAPRVRPRIGGHQGDAHRSGDASAAGMGVLGRAAGHRAGRRPARPAMNASNSSSTGPGVVEQRSGDAHGDQRPPSAARQAGSPSHAAPATRSRAADRRRAIAEHGDDGRRRHQAADRLPPGQLVAARDDVPERARAVGAQHGAGEVRVAAGGEVDGGQQRRARAIGASDDERPARARVSPPGSISTAPTAAPAPIVMTPPTSAPRRPAPTTSASADAAAGEGRRRAARERPRPASSAATPTSSSAESVASSSLPMP